MRLEKQDQNQNDSSSESSSYHCPKCGAKSFAEWMQPRLVSEGVQEMHTSSFNCLICHEALPDRRAITEKAVPEIPD